MNRIALTGLIVGLGLTATLCAAAEETRFKKFWSDPAINQRIDQNIEKYRKGDTSIEVLDAAGKPVAGAKIAVKQTGHEFLFGCNAFVLQQLKTPEQNKLYEDSFLKIFNFATVPFYWEGTEPARGELRYEEGSRDMWRRPPADRYIPWAAKNNVTLKGHPLLWHAYNPAWLPKDANELRELYKKRFREIAARYGTKIGIWDVVNESLVCNKAYPLYSDDRSYVEWAFKEAVPLFPEKNIMMINEVTSFNFRPADQNPYFAQVKSLLAKGAQIRGIGLQFHYFRRKALDTYLEGAGCDPARMLDLYERFAEFKLPLYITEITFPSAGDEGEKLQEDVVRNHYRLWFSAPTMAGITWWNLGDGTAVKGENEAMGGLLDGDFKPKASYRALDKLINEQWKTNADLQTDAKGLAPFRGFFGKYEIQVTVGGATRAFQINHSATGPKQHKLTLP